MEETPQDQYLANKMYIVPRVISILNTTMMATSLPHRQQICREVLVNFCNRGNTIQILAECMEQLTDDWLRIPSSCWFSTDLLVEIFVNDLIYVPAGFLQLCLFTTAVLPQGTELSYLLACNDKCLWTEHQLHMHYAKKDVGFLWIRFDNTYMLGLWYPTMRCT